MKLKSFGLSAKAQNDDLSHGRNAAAGFTLLETIIVLALCGVLVAAMSGATHLYWKYRSITQEQVHSAHLLRGIVEDLTLDLRATMSPAKPTLPNASDSDPAGNILNTANSLNPGMGTFGQEIVLDLVTDPMATPVHLVGTHRTLAIHTETENYRFGTIDAGDAMGSARHVVWWMNDGTSLRLPLALKGNHPQYTTLTASTLPHGLVRATSAILAPGRNAGAESQTPRLISDRVSAITFQYFDGEHWHSEWNSEVRNGIPSLVEIAVTLTDTPDRQETFAISIPQGQRW